MEVPIQHYSCKENGAEDQLMQTAMRTEWEPCLAHHPPLQSFVGCDDVVAGGNPPPPPPPSKRRFRSPHHAGKGGVDGSSSSMNAMNTMDGDRHGKMRGETLMERQVRLPHPRRVSPVIRLSHLNVMCSPLFFLRRESLED